MQESRAFCIKKNGARTRLQLTPHTQTLSDYIRACKTIVNDHG
jgi:hypothetical protein